MGHADRTAEFRALAPVDAKPRRSVRRTALDVEAEDVRTRVEAMETLVREVQTLYLRPKRFFRSGGQRMSEQEKDEFDADIMELVKSCSARIDVLKHETSVPAAGTNVRTEHQKEVVAYLLERLKDVANATKRMQKKRYEQPFLLSSRLLPEDERVDLEELEKKMVKPKPKTKRPSPALSPPHPQSESAPAALSTPPPTPPVATALKAPEPRDIPTPKVNVVQPPAPKPVIQTPWNASEEADTSFTEDEDRLFKIENVTLHRHFQENLEDARQMESKMAEISSLMGQFADKIMEQQTDIEMIHQHAQETKSNLTQSNRILEHTQKIGNGYGFMIFCFYFGFSVLLHVMHYFND